MTRRHRAKKTPTLRQGAILADGQIVQQRPKAGPGQAFRVELVSATGGHAKRFRNVCTSPVSEAWFRGRLVMPVRVEHHPGRPGLRDIGPDERYAAGLEIERLFAVLHATGHHDSTDPGISSHAELFLTEAKEAAGKRLRQIAAYMGEKDFAIAAKFLGEQWPAPHALQFAGVPFDRRSIWPRVCEMLDSAVYATQGRRNPFLAASSRDATTGCAILEPACDAVA